MISESEYEEMSEEIKSEREVYEKRLGELRKKNDNSHSRADLGELLNSIIGFEDIDRNTLLLLVDKVYIGKNKETEIRFKFDNPQK